VTEIGPVCDLRAPDFVAALAWHPDGQTLAAACADGSVLRITPDGGTSEVVTTHDGGACALAFSADGTLASAGEDGHLAIGDGGPRPAGAGWIEQMAWRPTGDLLATAVGRRVQMWTPAGDIVGESAQLPATVECLAWMPDATAVVAGGHGGIAFVGVDGEPARERVDWTGVVISLAFAADGRLACGMQDHAIWLWDLAAGRAATLGGYARKVRELAWSADGTVLATGGGSVPVIWLLPAGELEATGQAELRGHEKPVNWVGFQPGGGLLASAAEDGFAILWSPPHEKPLSGATLEEPVATGAWSPDGTRLALGGRDGRVAVFSVA
jgi:WD40 repeat protein